MSDPTLWPSPAKKRRVDRAIKRFARALGHDLEYVVVVLDPVTRSDLLVSSLPTDLQRQLFETLAAQPPGTGDRE